MKKEAITNEHSTPNSAPHEQPDHGGFDINQVPSDIFKLLFNYDFTVRDIIIFGTVNRKLYLNMLNSILFTNKRYLEWCQFVPSYLTDRSQLTSPQTIPYHLRMRRFLNSLLTNAKDISFKQRLLIAQILLDRFIPFDPKNPAPLLCRSLLLHLPGRALFLETHQCLPREKMDDNLEQEVAQHQILRSLISLENVSGLSKAFRYYQWQDFTNSCWNPLQYNNFISQIVLMSIQHDRLDVIVDLKNYFQLMNECSGFLEIDEALCKHIGYCHSKDSAQKVMSLISDRHNVYRLYPLLYSKHLPIQNRKILRLNVGFELACELQHKMSASVEWDDFILFFDENETDERIERFVAKVRRIPIIGKTYIELEKFINDNKASLHKPTHSHDCINIFRVAIEYLKLNAVKKNHMYALTHLMDSRIIHFSSLCFFRTKAALDLHDSLFLQYNKTPEYILPPSFEDMKSSTYRKFYLHYVSESCKVWIEYLTNHKNSLADPGQKM